MSSRPRPRRALIIGGGAIGLVTLRNFLERGDFENVELVERRANIGGVWYLDELKHIDTVNGRPRWPSPAYPGLMGNVLPKYLTFSGHPFPTPPSSPEQPFPDLIQTHAYLSKFAEPLFATGKIRLHTEVVGVDEIGPDGGWKVVMKDWSDQGKGREFDEIWDAVVIATAWYDNPNWPETEGLEELRKKEIAKHAKIWEGPDAFIGNRCAVVGNANSANDIASQLAPVAADPVFRSIRRPNMHYFPLLPHPRLRDISPIARYSLSDSGKATLHLEDGTEIPDIEHVLLGTGYAYAVPFIRVLDIEDKETLKQLCDPSIRPRRVPSLHRHILYAHNPTLAFLGGVVSSTPFILGDLTSTWLALAWSSPGSIQYPETPQERLETEKARLETIKSLRESMENPTSLLAYHVLGPAELSYAKTLREEVICVKPEFGEGENKLIEWSDSMWDEKEVMFGLKEEVLKRAREAARAQVEIKN